MRRSIVLATLGLLTLSACSTVAPGRAPPPKPELRPSLRPAPPPAASQATTTPVTYSCRAGKRFTAAYPASGDHAEVSAGGVTRSLPLARSASGARYEKDGFEIWGKGDAATLTGFPGGPYDACQAH